MNDWAVLVEIRGEWWLLRKRSRASARMRIALSAMAIPGCSEPEMRQPNAGDACSCLATRLFGTPLRARDWAEMAIWTHGKRRRRGLHDVVTRSGQNAEVYPARRDTQALAVPDALPGDNGPSPTGANSTITGSVLSRAGQ